jgi:penicillin-binding protein 2
VNPDSPRLRHGILGIVALSLFAALFARLLFLQVMTAPTYQVAAEANRARVVAEQAPRGRILDRNGKVIVDNRISIVVTLERTRFKELSKSRQDAILGRLAEELTKAGKLTTVAQLRRRLADQRFSPYQPVPLAQDIPETLEVYLAEHHDDFPGVAVEPVAVRHYPYGAVAAHLLGYVGEINGDELKDKKGSKKPYEQGDDIGKSGVERIYEDDLRGRPGLRRIEVDANGDPIRVIDRKEPIPGDDLVLSVDIDLQAAAEQALAVGIKATRQRPVRSGPPTVTPAGSIVVLDPQDGSVLAMASYPNYNPSDFVNGITTPQWDYLNDPAHHYPLNNRAIQGQYAPGSTFKLITAYAAMKTGMINAHTSIYDRGSLQVGNRLFKNAGTKAYGMVDIRRAITVSSDVFFYGLGRDFWAQRGKYGETAIQTAAEDFGLGQPTGVPLPSEQSGRMPTPEQRKQFCRQPGVKCVDDRWFPGDNVITAIGQGDVLVTPLQLADAYATFANGGTLYSPNVALRVLRHGSKQVVRQIAPRVVHQVNLPPEIRQPILDGLVGVTQNREGTAYAVFQGFPNDTFPVAAKTGTAEVHGKADTAVFSAFGPAPAPKFVVTVMLEEAGFGGVAAAPVARKVLDYVSGAVPLPPAPLGGVPGPDAKDLQTDQAASGRAD